MQQFSSRDLHLQTKEVLRSATASPVIILDHGEPQSVMMSVEEFRRLKIAAGETITGEVKQSRPVVRSSHRADPLGYDTSDLQKVALTMADAAESGRNREAVQAEIRAVERRLGIS